MLQQVSNWDKKFNVVYAGIISLNAYGTHTEHLSFQHNKVQKHCLLFGLFLVLLLLADAVCAQGIIIYTTEMGHNWVIVKTDESWQKFEPLTDGVIDTSAPTFSWNGKKIAFAGLDKVQRDIYWMDSDGQHIEQLTNHPLPEWWPSFSPDGKQLIFTRWSDRETASTVALDLLIKKERVLFKGTHATYSPDGQWIVFDSFENGNWEVYKTPADRFAPMNLSNHPAMDRDPVFSPDGQWIAFSSKRHGGPLQDIYKMRADGIKVTRLTGGLIGGELDNSVWSPSGKQILFQSGMQKIYRMDADGSNLKMVVENASDPAWFDPEFAQPFAVSPAGKLALTWGFLKRTQ